jgi:hypothetical protein
MYPPRRSMERFDVANLGLDFDYVRHGHLLSVRVWELIDRYRQAIADQYRP